MKPLVIDGEIIITLTKSTARWYDFPWTATQGTHSRFAATRRGALRLIMRDIRKTEPLVVYRETRTFSTSDI